MIQDLGDKKLDNAYQNQTPEPGDQFFRFDRDKILVKTLPGGRLLLPTAGELGCRRAQYLFSIGDDRYFLELPSKEAGDLTLRAPEGFTFESVRGFRRLEIKELAFAAATAYHLYQWYRDNRFCGRCGNPVEHSSRERALCCPSCGNTIYPKIAPAVIVALTDGDRILLTRYNGRAYKRYALIARVYRDRRDGGRDRQTRGHGRGRAQSEKHYLLQESALGHRQQPAAGVFLPAGRQRPDYHGRR